MAGSKLIQGAQRCRSEKEIEIVIDEAWGTTALEPSMSFSQLGLNYKINFYDCLFRRMI